MTIDLPMTKLSYLYMKQQQAALEQIKELCSYADELNSKQRLAAMNKCCSLATKALKLPTDEI